jgi:hypothetical protein
MISRILEVRFSASSGEVDIEGDTESLASFANSLAEGAAEILLADDFDPAPYQKLTAIRVVENPSGKVRLLLDSDAEVLEISGSQEYLNILIGNVVDFAREASPGTHQHIEYYDGHFYLAESTASLVIIKTS